MAIDAQMSQLLADMNALRAEAMQRDVLPMGNPAIQNPASGLGINKPEGSFGNVFKEAIHKVNELQQESSTLKKAYELGEPGVDIAQVMIASEKSKVGFTAMVEVRNKFVEAYKDVMNMSV